MDESGVCSMLSDMETHYGAQVAGQLRPVIQDFFESMPWVAKLRGSTIATPGGLTCVEGAEQKPADVGKGTAEQRDRQWEAFANSTIAPVAARTSPLPGGGWCISRAELERGLRRWNKVLLVRAGAKEEGGVVALGATRLAVTVPPGHCFSDDVQAAAPHALPLRDRFDTYVPSFCPDRLLTSVRCEICSGRKHPDSGRPRHLCPGRSTTANYKIATGQCTICEARYPAAASAKGNGTVQSAHVRRCRTIFVEEWRAADAKLAADREADLSGLEAMLKGLSHAERPD
eukprot:gene19623-biopygen10859